MQSRRKHNAAQRALVSPTALSSAGHAEAMMCPTCGGETQRFASGWRSLLAEGAADTVTVTVVCPVCRTNASSTAR